MTFGLRDDVEVVLGEVRGDHPRDQRLDLGDRLVLDHRIDRDRAGGDAGAAADHQHLGRVLRHQRRDVPEHALQAHVLRLARRLHLAGVVVVQHAVRRPGHRDRRGDAFADVDDLVLPDPRRRSTGRRPRDPGIGGTVRASRPATSATPITTTGVDAIRVLRFTRRRHQHQQARQRRNADQHLLRHLAARRCRRAPGPSTSAPTIAPTVLAA